MTMVGFSIANVSFPGFSPPLIMEKKKCNWRTSNKRKKMTKPFANFVEFPGNLWRLAMGPMEHPPAFSSHGGRCSFRHATRGEVEASRAAEKGGEPGDTRDGYPRKN